MKEQQKSHASFKSKSKTKKAKSKAKKKRRRMIRKTQIKIVHKANKDKLINV